MMPLKKPSLMPTRAMTTAPMAAQDLTQEQLALEADMPRAYASRVERGTINISMDNADILTKAGRFLYGAW
ncbi:helix-turn-helix domain-containing protein [Ideonella sp. YS5]|uniref:helix-turn-helix domain-containing protein n=1 Tax=Ideonella sp. YS5 TaxID=3453714 RepID=UPI003EEE4089